MQDGGGPHNRVRTPGDPNFLPRPLSSPHDACGWQFRHGGYRWRCNAGVDEWCEPTSPKPTTPSGKVVGRCAKCGRVVRERFASLLNGAASGPLNPDGVSIHNAANEYGGGTCGGRVVAPEVPVHG